MSDVKPWCDEDCVFEAEVVEVKGGPSGCRCGHEVGDTYRFAYTTPADLCGEFYHHLYPTLHALRAGGDMRAFQPDAPAGEVLIWCPSRVVRLRLRAKQRTPVR